MVVRENQYIFRTVLACALCVLVLFIGGCGGGTRGSGGQFYDGFVGDGTGKALPNVRVTLLASGDSAISDSRGLFSIQTDPLFGPLEVLLERDDLQASTTTTPVPVDAKRIRLTITVSGGERPQVSASIQVVERRRDESQSEAKPDRPGGDDDGRDGDSDHGRDDSNDDSSSDDSRGDDSNDDSSEDDSNDSDSDDSDGDDSADDSHQDGSSDGDSDGDDSVENDGDGDSGEGSGDGQEGPEDGDTKQAEGAITSLSGTTFIVEGVTFTVASSSELRDEDGNATNFDTFAVGQSVKARGRYQGGILILERLERED
jgi:hypothetical protein